MTIVKGDEKIVIDFVKDGEVYMRKFIEDELVDAFRVDAAAFVSHLIEALADGALVLG